MKNYKQQVISLLIHSIPLLVIVFVSFIANRFPVDSSVAGGDFYQIRDPLKHFSQYFYAWINQIGQGQLNTIFPAAPFYLILAFLDFSGFSSGFISSFLIFLLLYGSYLSFYFSVQWMYSHLSQEVRVGGSMLYTLNYFTFSILTYPWGFTHHFLFYIFIPPLLILFLKILFDRKMCVKPFVLFTLIFLGSTVAYANIAFLVILFLIQFLLFVIFFCFGQISTTNLIKKIVVFAFIYIAVFGYFIVVFYASNYQYQSHLSQSAVLGGHVIDFVRATSNDVLHVFALDLYKADLSLNALYPIVLYLLLFLFLYKKGDNSHENKVILGFTVLFILCVFLAVRIQKPFLSINSILYQSQLFSLFRSPEKIFTFIPFIFSMLIVGIIHNVKMKRNFTLGIFFILLIIPYYFYSGGITNTLKHADKAHPYIVQIPEEYDQSAYIVNKDKRLTSVISLPYSVTNSINWSDYPRWGFIGMDILYMLYDKYFISANVFDNTALETELSFKEYNELKEVDEVAFLKLLQKFSGQFVLFHKDVDAHWVSDSELVRRTLSQLYEKNVLTKVSDNDYFTLYALKDKYIKPLISSDAGNIIFKKINPSKYRVSLKDIDKKTTLNFHQAFQPLWYVFIEPVHPITNCIQKYDYPNFNVSECQYQEKFFEGDEFSLLFRKPVFDDVHILADNYANGWTISPEYIKQNFSKEYYTENQDGSINISLTLYFKPQSYFYLGLIISGATLLGCLGYLLYVWRVGRKSKIKENLLQ